METKVGTYSWLIQNQKNEPSRFVYSESNPLGTVMIGNAVVRWSIFKI